MTNTAVTENMALLLEKILIFNYILSNQQQPALRVRNIKTRHDLPPGNPIAK